MIKNFGNRTAKEIWENSASKFPTTTMFQASGRSFFQLEKNTPLDCIELFSAGLIIGTRLRFEIFNALNFHSWGRATEMQGCALEETAFTMFAWPFE